LSAAAALLAVALAHGGCALSYRLDSILGAKDERKEEVTGAIAQGAFAAATPADLPEADLVYAKAAAAELLARGGPDSSMPWANPNTGAHGTITPIAASYSQNGATCRDFLASYLRGNRETWLHGEACRSGSRWDVKTLKPFNRT
jgi:surface antigen